MPSAYFFFNDPATTEIYTLSLHDALPISTGEPRVPSRTRRATLRRRYSPTRTSPGARATPTYRPGVPTPHEHTAVTSRIDRKSTRLNSSHANISYAVFCLNKKTTLLPGSR